jgi:hypothetical protein
LARMRPPVVRFGGHLHVRKGKASVEMSTRGLFSCAAPVARTLTVP